VDNVAFEPLGKRLITGCRDLTARMWSVPDGKLLQAFEGTDASREIRFDPRDPERVLFRGHANEARVMRMNIDQEPGLRRW
jgi:WD40 repeat protein